jgi:hypothetical protein
MTNLDDFDRALGDFLRDGPTVAPEPPVIAAMAHARTTPRRRDLLGAFRPDVMARPMRLAGLRPGVVLAGATLLVAGIGIALVGSRNHDTLPGPSASPSGEPSATPRTGTWTVPLVTAGGGPLVVTVRDTSGFLLDATSGQPGDGVSVGENDVRILVDPAADPDAMLVIWSGPPCERTGSVDVDENEKTISIARDGCSGGDSIAFDRVLRLRFGGPVQPAAWRGNVGGGIASPAAGSPLPSGAAPSADATVTLRDTGGNPAWIDVFDESHHLTEARLGQLGQSEAPEFLTATNLDPRTVRIAWPGAPCDTVHRLTIAADFGLTLDRPRCFGDSIPAFYALELVFDTDVNADGIDLSLQEGRVESGLPTHVVTGIDAAGNRYDLAIFDGSGRLRIPEPFSDGTQPLDPGPTGAVVERRADAVGRLTWRAPACAASQTLRIDASASDWRLSWDPCAAPPTVLRVVDLTFDHLPDTTGIAVTVDGPQL